jgi:hypothetical protein
MTILKAQVTIEMVMTLLVSFAAATTSLLSELSCISRMFRTMMKSSYRHFYFELLFKKFQVLPPSSSIQSIQIFFQS